MRLLELSDEPVTPERLGWDRVGFDHSPTYISPRSHRVGPVVQIAWAPWMDCDGWYVKTGKAYDTISNIETMGQLVALCYGLGIELKGGA